MQFFFKPQRIFFLTLCQNNFRNKILFLHFTIQIWTNLSVSVVWLDNKTCQLIKQDSPSFFSFSVKMRWLHKKKLLRDCYHVCMLFEKNGAKNRDFLLLCKYATNPRTNVVKMKSSTKGPLISEWLFCVFNFLKKQRNNLMNFCPRT